MINFNATGTSPINYTWACSGVDGGASSPTCSANYTPPVVDPICGNGIIEGTETCDDGAQNGQPGMCNLSCTGDVVSVCTETFT